MTHIDYSLLGANGDQIDFDYDNYVLNPGFLGFGIAPTQVRIEESAGDGGLWRNTKKGIRDIDLPITVLGTSRDDVQAKLRRLSKLIQDGDGPTKLLASYNHGTEETLSLEIHYVGGAEGSWGPNQGLTWATSLFSFQAPNPFWQTAETEDFTVGTGNTGRGLLPQLTKLKVSSSQTLGVITVTNSGDVPAYPIWRVRGPIEDFFVSDGTNSFGFNAEVFTGETITIDTATGSVTDDLGANRYDILLPAPKLFPIKPGVTSLTVTGVANSLNAQVVLSYSPRYEVVH